MTINIAPPICLCGLTPDGRMVLGGLFQMSDTMGVPLWFMLDQAKERNFVVSFPHYFASAIEHGWDDIQTFGKIREALMEHGGMKDFDRIKQTCVVLFMRVADSMPGKTATDVGKRMRELIESDKLTQTLDQLISTNPVPALPTLG